MESGPPWWRSPPACRSRSWRTWGIWVTVTTTTRRACSSSARPAVGHGRADHRPRVLHDRVPEGPQAGRRLAGHALDAGRADGAGVGLPGPLRPVGEAGRRPGRRVLDQVTAADEQPRWPAPESRVPADAVSADRRPPTADRRPPTADCRPPTDRQGAMPVRPGGRRKRPKIVESCCWPRHHHSPRKAHVVLVRTLVLSAAVVAGSGRRPRPARCRGGLCRGGPVPWRGGQRTVAGVTGGRGRSPGGPALWRVSVCSVSPGLT